MGRQVATILFRNAALGRMVLAFAAFNLADWARWLALLVYAFERGGAAEAGLVSLVQLVPAAAVAPLAANLGDRWSRAGMLRAAYVGQAIAMAATAAALVTGAPSLLVYVFAMLAVIATSLTRPAHASLLPSVTRTPEELTAANAASGWMEGLGILAGPLVAGVILGVSTPAMVFILAAALMALGGGLVLRLGDAPEGAALAAQGTAHGTDRSVLAGFAALRALPGPRTIVLLMAAASGLWGAVDVLNVALAIDVLGTGPAGAGALGAGLGVGGLLGAVLSTTLVGRTRLAGPFLAGLTVWGLPLVAIAALPLPLNAFVLLVAAGAGRSLMDVAARTLLQRASPERVLSRIFGIVEMGYLGSFGLGSILVAWLIVGFGVRTALLVAGLWLPVVALLAWSRVRAIDSTSVVPVERLALLRSIPMFGLLPGPTMERLARALVPVPFRAGATIIREGDVGDAFYVVDSGTVAFTVDGRPVGEGVGGPGSSFGEIALLRDLPRTASVTASTDVSAYSLGRDVFLEVMTGFAPARQVAEQVAEARLGA